MSTFWSLVPVALVAIGFLAWLFVSTRWEVLETFTQPHRFDERPYEVQIVRCRVTGKVDRRIPRGAQAITDERIRKRMFEALASYGGLSGRR